MEQEQEHVFVNAFLFLFPKCSLSVHEHGKERRTLVTSPNFAPEQTSRSNAAWPMPACRAPRALRRADVEPKPYLVVACVGLTFDASACDALVFAVRCRATRACVRDAAVSLLCVPVHKACYDAGFARAWARASGTCRWGSPWAGTVCAAGK